MDGIIQLTRTTMRLILRGRQGQVLSRLSHMGLLLTKGFYASMLSNYPTTFSSGQIIMHGSEEGTAMVTLQEAFEYVMNIPLY